MVDNRLAILAYSDGVHPLGVRTHGCTASVTLLRRMERRGTALYDVPFHAVHPL